MTIVVINIEGKMTTTGITDRIFPASIIEVRSSRVILKGRKRRGTAKTKQSIGKIFFSLFGFSDEIFCDPIKQELIEDAKGID